VLVDTHCHLDSRYCPGGADAALERARGAGVGAFVAIGVGSLEAAREAIALAERRVDVAATVGVHPHEAGAVDAGLFDAIAGLARHPAVVAVGEIGLDYHYEHSPREVQVEVFRRFVDLARTVGKPVVVHTREAPLETLDVLESTGARDVGGIIHCFSEDIAFARRAFDLGFDVSFSGIVTFKSASAVQEVARFAPEDRILVETDAPYLAPVPMRGRPNEPAYIVHTAARVAELRGVSLARLTETTTANARRRFGERLDRALQACQSSG